MEDLAGEKEVSGKRKINLNTLQMGINGRRGKRKEMNFFLRNNLKIEGKENDMRECKECHKILPLVAFTTHVMRSNGVFALKGLCRECHTIGQTQQREALKNAPPKPDHCDCCGTKKALQGDHIHGSTVFRGWLCRNCNTGIGSLGDNLEGLLRAAIYLEKDKSKIIEILNEME